MTECNYEPTLLQNEINVEEKLVEGKARSHTVEDTLKLRALKVLEYSQMQVISVRRNKVWEDTVPLVLYHRKP
uniref:Uncharacterized protein n=1 Tax=Amphimedon queenslandica TaxID=400682 RepID=A0A1X7SKD8_AMPQE